MTTILTSSAVKGIARSLGFPVCGLAQAAPVAPAVATAYRQWIARGGHAEMDYLARNVDKRLDPTLLMPGARTMVCVALGYSPARHIAHGEYQIAAYAYGHDYHEVMKDKLCQLAERLCLAEGVAVRAFCDTAPVLERYWAVQAGLGWTGRNRQLIIPGAGSQFFLGELLTTAPADCYDQPTGNRCGNCHACTDACEALRQTARTPETFFNAAECLSYQTIEHRGELSPEAQSRIGDSIYGCDRCQSVCPWNRFAKPTAEPLLQPSEALLAMTRDDWHRLTVEDYRRLFKGSAVKRAKYEGLVRNIQAARACADITGHQEEKDGHQEKRDKHEEERTENGQEKELGMKKRNNEV